MITDDATDDTATAAAPPATSPPATPPPPVPRPSELERLVDGLERAFSGVLDEQLQAFRKDVLGPIRTAAGNAADAHKPLLEELRLTDRKDPRDLGRRVAAYREAVRARIVAPLRDVLAAMDAKGAVAALIERRSVALVAIAIRTTEEVRQPEPADLYRPDTRDPLGQRFGKLAVRSRRAWARWGRAIANLGRRIGRRPPRVARAFTQIVPLRRLADYHARVRLPAALGPADEAMWRAAAAPVARIEAAISAWTAAVLAVERTLERPSRPAAPDDGDTPPDISPAATASGAANVLAREAEALDAALEAVAGVDDGTRPLAAAIDDALEASWRELRRDNFLAGSFMLLIEDREPPPDDGGRGDRRAQRLVEAWAAWHAEAIDRVTLEERLLGLRQAIVDDRDRLRTDVADGAVDPLLALLSRAGSAIEALHDEAAQACDAAPAHGGAKALDARLEELGKAAARALERDLLAAFADGAIERQIQEAADDAVERLASTLGDLPETLRVHEPSLEGPREAGAEPATVRMAVIAGRTFDALLLERLRMTPHPVIAAIERIHAEAAQLPSVVRFNVDAARDELSGGRPGGDHIGAARELALNGLARTGEAIAGHAAVLSEGSAASVDEASAVFARGWDGLVERVRVEDRVQEQLLDLRYRLRMATHRLSERAGIHLRQGAETGRRVVRLGRGRAEELVRLSQTAMGASDMSDEAMQATLDALSGLERMIAGQPLVYRRLFSFQPLADPALLQGRDVDIAIVRRHYEHWRDGQTDAICITGYDGNGRSSFANVLRQTMFGDADVQSISIDSRIVDETRFALLLAGVLGIAEERAGSLDALAAALLETPTPTRPRVVFIERMEHLFLRTAAGNGLIAQALAFLSRTDSRIFWIVTMGDYMWQYLSRVDQATASLVKRYGLTPLAAADLERIIQSRHVRSGLPLEFDAPAVPNPLLKRKLRRAATAEDRQAVLRTEYFERLARFAGQNILLGFFYWLRSAELDAPTGVLRIRPCEPLDFAYLDRFTLQQGFTLKAFLEHGTLTLDEHCDIFQVGRESSRKTLESLGNFLLIEPADRSARAADFVFSTIAESSAYRIRPLVIHPVLLYLRSKNIVY